jgi:hypothetical protein
MYNSELDKVLQKKLYFRFIIRIAKDKTSTTNTVTLPLLRHLRLLYRCVRVRMHAI